MSDINLPNESEDYRRLREELLAAEMEHAKTLERVAELRRKLHEDGCSLDEKTLSQGVENLSMVTQVRLCELLIRGNEVLLNDTIFKPSFADTNGMYSRRKYLLGSIARMNGHYGADPLMPVWSSLEYLPPSLD